jgi:hypothetical protein
MEHQQMEVESQLLAEQFSCSTDQQKGMILDLFLLMFIVVKCLAVMCSTGDGARPLLRCRQPTSKGEGGGRGKG